MSRNNRRPLALAREIGFPTPNAQRATFNVQLYSSSFSSLSSIFVREPSEGDDDDETDSRQVENCSRTSIATRVGRPVRALIGHQSVRAFERS
jgi:hypothetical protein